MKRVSVLLITLALIAGMASCAADSSPDPSPPARYDLSIASTEGGAVTTPGEGTFTYDGCTVVPLAATPTSGYQFVNWTGDVEDVADVKDATTTIIMQGNCQIIASFQASPLLEYTLTISSTTGGSVIAPGEGTFVHDAGTAVDLVAEAEEGFRFSRWVGNVDTVADINAAATVVTVQADCSVTASFRQKPEYTALIAAGGYHTIGLRADGAVTAVGLNGAGQCEVGDWTDIVGVAAGMLHTVGVKADGGVVAVGYNHQGQCETGGWTDIMEVAAGNVHTVGLRAGGTVVTTGSNTGGQCDVEYWTDIIQVQAGWGHTVGLRADGTVVAAGENIGGQCDVEDWTDIIQVQAGRGHTVGLKADGTVVAVGDNTLGQCGVHDWANIVEIIAGSHHTVGLKADGTVVAVGNNDYGQCGLGGWTDIIRVAAGALHTVGLKADGTVVAVGNNSFGQCSVSDWVLN